VVPGAPIPRGRAGGVTGPAELYQIAGEVRAIANLGLHYATDNYDRERYARLLGVAARLLARLEARPPAEMHAQLADNLFHVSPLIGAEAAVWAGGRLLLIQRRDNGLWALPGGLAEVGESAAEAARRELREETGVNAKPVRLLALFDGRYWSSQYKAHLYHVVFEARAAAGDGPVPGPEALAADYFAPDQLPPLAPGHAERLPVVIALLRGERPAPFFDQARPA
jgi:ADP-ribose pyrophosphatase YjhB (NUDIX family)